MRVLFITPHPDLLPQRLCRNCRTCIDVILSASEESLFSRTYRREILRLLPQDDIKTQSRKGKKEPIQILRALQENAVSPKDFVA